MKNDKLVLAFVFFLNGLTMSFFVKPWFLGLPMMVVAVIYLLEGLDKQDQSNHSNQDKSIK